MLVILYYPRMDVKLLFEALLQSKFLAPLYSAEMFSPTFVPFALCTFTWYAFRNQLDLPASRFDKGIDLIHN